MGNHLHPFSIGLFNIDNRTSSLCENLKRDLAKIKLECHKDIEASDRIAIIGYRDPSNSADIKSILHDSKSKDRKTIVINFNNQLNDNGKLELLYAGINEIFDANGKNISSSGIISRLERWKRIEELLLSQIVQERIIGSSHEWTSFLRKVIEVAYFSSVPILLMGESGTGKELIAGMIHALDQRKVKKDLILLDCTTIVPELSGSEFYGHEKGAFTNAIYTREGAFALADGGSLFLDEIGETPIILQAGLLRVVQEGTYKRVGSNIWRKTNFRLISATNKKLQEEIKKGHFREDLYFRIATTIFTVPPLREHREDIPELVRFFLKQELNFIPEIDPTVMNFLRNREYPGNIRELKQQVTKLLIHYTGEGSITIGHIFDDELPERNPHKVLEQNGTLEKVIREAVASGKDLASIKDDVSYIAVIAALEESSGNIQKAAGRLKQSVRNLQKIKQKNKELHFM